jgi:hypothetical protein
MQLIRFTDVIRHRFPGSSTLFDELEVSVRDYQGHFRSSYTRPVPYDEDLLPAEITEVFRLSMLCHARNLIWTLIHCVNGGMVPGMYLSTRAHMEVTAALAYAVIRWRGFRAGTVSLDDLTRALTRLFLSRRSDLDSLAPNLVPEVKEFTEDGACTARARTLRTSR